MPRIIANDLADRPQSVDDVGAVPPPPAVSLRRKPVFGFSSHCGGPFLHAALWYSRASQSLTGPNEGTKACPDLTDETVSDLGGEQSR